MNTRAIHQQAQLTKLCSGRGWDVLEYPCIGVDITNTAQLREHLSAGDATYSWLVITSSNTVDAIVVALENASCSLPALACVGAATARYAEQQLGNKVVFVPSAATGTALAEELPLHSGERVLLPQSAIANPETVAILQSRGANVDVLNAYSVHTESGGDDVPAGLDSGLVDAVIVTSPSALDGFLTRMDAAGVPLSIIKQLVFAPIGPTTAKAIVQNCLHSLPVPTEHSLEGIVDVLTGYFDRLETPNETVQA